MACVVIRIVAVSKKAVWLEFWVSLSCLLASAVLTPLYNVPESLASLGMAEFAPIFEHVIVLVFV